MPDGFQVFLSHAKEDYQLVYRIWDILRRLKVRSYMHELYPDYRQDIPTGIREALENCVICITFLTHHGIDSQWVQQELGIAHAFEKIILPVVQKGVKYKGFVEMLKKVPYQPRSSDATIHGVIYAVRAYVMERYDAVNRGLALTCPSDHENDYILPSNLRINQAIKAGNVFAFKCYTCGAEIRVSPQTLEVVP